ncbi:hypothetical protein NDU88_004233 [Pleurodeles waltl]|uniref:Uncharacterized protein n=1 Tax=Pleurodeles waltl TaxID=8319 RepID=A0AAV7W4D8_PLEWA|nr:hypothetical protein NDU88_004233 [Pleurodeles waltl]
MDAALPGDSVSQKAERRKGAKPGTTSATKRKGFTAARDACGRCPEEAGAMGGPVLYQSVTGRGHATPGEQVLWRLAQRLLLTQRLVFQMKGKLGMVPLGFFYNHTRPVDGFPSRNLGKVQRDLQPTSLGNIPTTYQALEEVD